MSPSAARTPRFEVSRRQILAFRRRVAPLDTRLPSGVDSLRDAAWAGLQDSMPRAALLSLHARVEGIACSDWDHPAFVQVWGPRFSTYVVAERDRGIFTVGRYPDDERGRSRADDMARRVRDLLGDRTMTQRRAGAELGIDPNALRYAAPTGTVLIRWEGAGAPTIRSVPAPDIEPSDARLELARRHLHVFGPATVTSFCDWAGIRSLAGRRVFDALSDELTAVRTPLGEAWILAEDEEALRAESDPPAGVRLLPSGDTFSLLRGRERELLVPDDSLRDLLWTPRVWPGAILAGGEIVGTWRRSGATVTVHPWQRLDRATRRAVQSEAASLPLPGDAEVSVGWEE